MSGGFLENNDYIMKLNALISAALLEPEIRREEIQSTFPFFSNSKTILKNNKLEVALMALNIILEDKNNYITSYDGLIDFCQFIRYSEKLLFYDNNPNRKLYIDSSLHDTDKGHILINGDYYQLLFKLEDRPVENRPSLHCIHILAKHNDGKKLENKFVVVDGTAKYNDISDRYLMDRLTLLLQNTVKETLRCIVNEIMKEYKWQEGEVRDYYDKW